MNSLILEDITVKLADFTWDGGYTDVEQLANTFTIISRASAYIEPTFIITGDPKWFLLDNIEAGGTVKQLRWSSMGAFWYGQSLPRKDGSQGNPYYRNPAVGRRVLVAAATDMMMYDRDMDRGQKCNNHYIGGAMQAWLYAYEQCQEVLDEKAKDAFHQGFSRMLDRIYKWGPQDVCTNMSMRSVATAAHLYALSKDLAVRDKAIRATRLLLFGAGDGSVEKCDSDRGAFYLAGYVGENDGPETTYNGVSHYHILEARASTLGDPAWDFLDPVLERMTDFAMFQRFRDPDGMVEGPSGYACRTGGSYVRWQRMRAWANATWADLYTGARPILQKQMKAPAAMISETQQRLRTKAMTTLDTTVPPAWANDHSEHWQPDVPCYPSQGWYQRLYELDAKNDPSMTPPFERQDFFFSKPFGPPGQEEFWAYKNTDGNTDFGFFLEHVPRSWPYGSWAGGSMQAFWTRKTGILILCRHNFKDTDDFSTIATWPTDHVWYVTASGQACSTAKYYNKAGKAEVKGTFTGTKPFVEIQVGFATSGKSKCSGTVHTRYEALPNGARVVKALTDSVAEPVREAWSTIPVFLCATGEGRRQSEDTTIEYQVDGVWKTLGTDLVETACLRLGRNFGQGPQYGYIAFAAPQRAKLSPQVWLQTYQGSLRLRSIHLDLKGSGDRLAKGARVEYAVQTTPPAAK